MPEWLTPKTNWTAADCETCADWNRQNGNLRYLAAVALPELGYHPAHDEQPTADWGTLPTALLLNRLEANLSALASCGVPLPSGWQASKTWAAGAAAPGYADANRWENNALLLYDLARRAKAAFKPCGTFAAGQSGILPRMVT